MEIKSVTHAHGVATFEIGFSLLSGGQLPVCMVQLLPVSAEAIEQDSSRTHALGLLRELLLRESEADPTPALDEMIPERPASLIVLPEYALGSSDWNAVDEMVRSSARPLVLIAGFGKTNGNWLKAWAADDPDNRFLAWQEDEKPIAKNNRYNGGWCWLHEPNKSTTCILFLKNFLEQGREAADPTMRAGLSITCCRFEDLVLFPLICADLLESARRGSHTPRQRIGETLSNDATNKPILVTASLLQETCHDPNWPKTIAEFVGDPRYRDRTVLLLTNHACARPSTDEDLDRWRSLTGLYVAFEELPKIDIGLHLPSARPIILPGMSGVLIRESHPCVAAGRVTWPPYRNPTTNRFIWGSSTLRGIRNGSLAPANELYTNLSAFELHRFTVRHPAKAGWSPRVSRGLEVIRTHLAGGSDPTAARIIGSLLFGVEEDPIEFQSYKSDELFKNSPALEEALHALAVLKSIDELSWQNSANRTGQVRHAAGPHVLVWRDRSKSPGQMVRNIEEWSEKFGEHPLLVVFGSGARSPLREGKVGDRRSNFAKAPSTIGDGATPDSNQETGRDLTTAASRIAVCFPLTKLSEIYEDYIEDEDASKANSIATLITS